MSVNLTAEEKAGIKKLKKDLEAHGNTLDEVYQLAATKIEEVMELLAKRRAKAAERRDDGYKFLEGVIARLEEEQEELEAAITLADSKEDQEEEADRLRGDLTDLEELISNLVTAKDELEEEFDHYHDEAEELDMPEIHHRLAEAADALQEALPIEA